ncbi:MAG TPA: DUF547 domain-containing protein [bacterium]|nr:DUF547 domain-containing protein [bacterium]
MRTNRFLFILLLSVVLLTSASAKEVFDHNHTLLDQVLKTFVRDGKIKYADLKKSERLIDEYINRLQDVNERELALYTPEQRLAYWLNFYNALTLKSILDNYPINGQQTAFPADSVRQIEGFWAANKWDTPLGRLTLNQIEFEILRKMGTREWIFGVCKGANGSGVLLNESFNGTRIHEQLRKATTLWINNQSNMRIEVEERTIHVANYITGYLPDLKRDYYKRNDFLKHSYQNNVLANLYLTFGVDEEAKTMLRAGVFNVIYAPTDWGLNEAR